MPRQTQLCIHNQACLLWTCNKKSRRQLDLCSLQESTHELMPGCTSYMLEGQAGDWWAKALISEDKIQHLSCNFLSKVQCVKVKLIYKSNAGHRPITKHLIVVFLWVYVWQHVTRDTTTLCITSTYHCVRKLLFETQNIKVASQQRYYCGLDTDFQF